MNAKRIWKTAVYLLIGLFLAACQSQVVTQTVEVTRVVTETITVEGEEVIVTSVVGELSVEEVSAVVTPEPELTATPESASEEAALPTPGFEDYGVNPYVNTAEDNLSTFAIDVDTGSYTIMRNYLQNGQLPPYKAVRVEEFINYFDQQYPLPEAGAFAVHLEGAPAPYSSDEGTYLVRIGIQGYDIDPRQRPNAMLIFVVDVSGSMDQPNRLPLVKESLRLMLDKLQSSDRVGIVVYGDSAEVVLEPTAVESRALILHAIDQLQPAGSTNAFEGLYRAYQLAAQFANPGDINRLILCSDGVANVGPTTADVILQNAQEGISLSTFGFGMGDYNDVLMEQLADQGDGNYAYIDDLGEAERVFQNKLTSTIFTIAKDAKIQVEFNPAVVAQYRLLGYENREVADTDFRNDAVDAGEIGAGHSVTALYEVRLVENMDAAAPAMTVFVRYADPQTNEVKEIAQTMSPQQFLPAFQSASATFQLSAVVAEYAEILRHSYWAQGNTVEQLTAEIQRIAALLPADKDVQEFASLVAMAAGLSQ